MAAGLSLVSAVKTTPTVIRLPEEVEPHQRAAQAHVKLGTAVLVVIVVVEVAVAREYRRPLSEAVVDRTDGVPHQVGTADADVESTRERPPIAKLRPPQHASEEIGPRQVDLDFGRDLQLKPEVRVKAEIPHTGDDPPAFGKAVAGRALEEQVFDLDVGLPARRGDFLGASDGRGRTPPRGCLFSFFLGDYLYGPNIKGGSTTGGGS